MDRTRSSGPARLACLAACLLVATVLVGPGSAGATPSAPPGARSATAALPADPPASPSTGCATSTVGAGDTTLTTSSGGVDRTYIRHVPPAHDGTTPIPLVIALHGLAEGSFLHQSTTEYAPRADANGFAVAYPQALGNPAAWNLSATGPDVAFVTQVLDELEASLCIDTNRVFMSGFSLGAMLTSTLMCGPLSGRIAAAAPVAGMRAPAGCAAERPVPAITFHGTADNWVPFATAPVATAAWAARNGCDPTPSETPVPGDDVVTIDHLVYSCPDGADVEWYRITGGGHAWPGSAFSRAIAAAVGYTTFAITASDLIWDFFEAHPLAAPATEQTGAIRGTVTDARGAPVANGSVWAYRPTDGWVGTGGAVTGADGTYEISGLPVGDYQVFFLPVRLPGLHPEWYDATTRSSATLVPVTAAGVTPGIDADLEDASSVAGTVTAAGGAPILGVQVWAYAPTDWWIGTAMTVTDATGHYSLEGLAAGGYQIRFAPVGLPYRHEWFDDAATRSAATPVVVTLGGVEPTADAVLAAR